MSTPQDSGIVRYRLEVSYKGAAYAGWQIQPNADTIEAQLLKAAAGIGIRDAKIIGAGRTDAGVHAQAQGALLTGISTIPGDRLAYAMNTRLPDDIRINRSAAASTYFHPRYSALGKIYTYQVWLGEQASPFYAEYAWRFHCDPDMKLMREAADILTGSHDFNAYKSSGSSVKTTVRRIDDIFIEREGPLLTLRFQGNGFLYNMVRILTGTIVQAGTGKIPIEQVRRSLVSRSRGDAGITAPPQGLCLTRVLYPEDPEWDSQKHSEIL